MTSTMSEILDHPAFRKAQDLLRADHDRMVGEIITLTEIPAPPFAEERRAAAYLDMMRDAGLEDVQLDGIGNVTGLMPGSGNGGIIVVAAHLDTVFPEGTDVTVRREGTRLMAPGVGDDTRALAVNLSLIRSIRAAGLRTRSDILFVGDVGEEGKGDLRGIRHLLTEGAYRERVEGFFTVDGLESDALTSEAVGSYRYRVTFSGPGGHSYMAFGTVNPMHALAAVVTGLSQLDVPAEPKTTYAAATLGGGTSINAIPNEVWLEVDLRSVSQAELDRIDAAFHQMISTAVEAENRRGNAENGKITAHAERIGNRPAGRNADGSPFVASAAEAVAAFGFTPRFDASSTDANIPISLGIPAVRIGSGGTGGRAHSLDEWIDVEPELSLRGIYAILAAILAAAGMED
ncbi:M20/M25/M40 family metallo-hydrolase [Pseudooceanicola sp. 216_PA32_1]|uniref:M20/M25/M40 family metallo-hydrolase n=1 Tax=Pseudooceanicola pacificus TaxID=2676438 RepID=A0A844W3J4_9RHOB|nr:M20/M25/M40 family metallo-hydrolase [Pseudooceanicola pacificus]MWB78756.1 M20/M25/M40 family metallo-hydrolase [Pseudooceanicola pacificus]